MKINNLEQKAVRALEACFEDIPFVELEKDSYQPTKSDDLYDFIISAIIDGEPQGFVIEVKKNGEPRYARQAANQLLRFTRERQDIYGVLIAPYISPQSTEICIRSGIGYVDFAGNCHLSFGKIFIQKEGKSNPYSEKRYLRSLYSPKAERILRVLLVNGPKEWKTEELAEEADVSIGLVAKVKDLLLDREWINTQTIGFSLTEPFAILEEWSSNYKFSKNEFYDFYTMLDVSDIEYRLGEASDKLGIQVGLTGFSGAARFAPMVRYPRAMAYVNADLEPLVEMLELKPVSSGSNLSLMKPYDEGVFYQSQDMNEVPVISPIQIYLDLRNLRGRGEEAAQAIMEKVLQKIW